MSEATSITREKAIRSVAAMCDQIQGEWGVGQAATRLGIDEEAYDILVALGVTEQEIEDAYKET